MVHQTIPEEIQTIIKEYGEEIVLCAGETLFQQGDPSEGVYMVLNGKLTVHTQSKTGAVPTLLNYIMPGEILGEIGAITGWTRTATLTADRPTTLIRLTQKQFQTVLRKTPSLAKLIMGTTGSFLVSADAERVNLGRSYQQMRMRVSALGEEKEQLQELLRLREEMEAMLVHDLRNPLNIVQTGITLLEPIVQGQESEETTTTILELMESSVRRMLRLTDTLLDIAKMEAGQTNLEIMEFNLAALVDAILSEQSTQFKEKDITLTSEISSSLNVQADRDVIYRVITNLIDNAIKFTPDSGQINITVKPVKQTWAKVAVTDSGPGIPEQERERIFEKFTQIKVNAPPKRKGTGLGLTFCRMAVEAHGGKIWVEPSTDDKGASFQFKLPLIPPEL